MPDGVVSVPEVSGWNYLNLGSDDVFAAEESILNGAAPASVAWPSAGLALYIPLYVSAPGMVQGLFWQNGTAVAGNVELALYDEDGNKLATTGLIVAAGVSAPQYTAFASPVLLTTGRYYLALVASSASQTFLAWGTTAVATNVNRMFGILEQAGLGGGLPAAWTPVTSARSYLPLVSISFASVAV
jgi:hypothetical protein